MARARNIKPGLYQNDELAQCSVWARYIFPGLWLLADRDGKLEDRPARIKAALFPYDAQNVDKLLAELSDHRFIIRYSIGASKYIKILNFRKHQNPHCKEPASIIPEPQGSDSNECLAPDNSGARISSEPEENSSRPADSGFPITDSLIPPETGRERDELFDAISDVTGLDADTAGSHIGKVCAVLRRAKPAYTPEEVRDFGRRFGELCPFAATNGEVRLPNVGELQKYIGRVRKAKTKTPVSDDEQTEYLRRETERQQRDAAERAKLSEPRGEDDDPFAR